MPTVNVDEKKKTVTTVVIPEGTTAKVRENVDGKILNYDAQIKEEEDASDESTIDDTILQDQNSQSHSYQAFEPLVKSPLERMFDDVRIVADYGESFYASVTRMPDGMSDRFNVPCTMQMVLGTFQFNSQDFVNFIPALQRLNGGSGGRFSVTVFRFDGKQLFIEKRAGNSFATSEFPVGVNNLIAPNPIRELDKENVPRNSGDDIASIIIQMQEHSDRQFQRFMEMQNKPKEMSVLEQAIQQKVLKDILDPPKPENSNQGFEERMMTILAMPQMVEGMARRMFPENPTPAEPDIMDKIGKILESPLATQAMNRVGDIAEAITVAKLTAGNPATTTDIPQPIQETQAEGDEMQEMIAEVLEELESDTPFDSNNEFLKELQEDYPSQAEQLITSCQIMEFDQVLKMLLAMTNKIVPYPFAGFIDVEQTQEKGKLAFNERGLRLVKRLEELYGFCRTQG